MDNSKLYVLVRKDLPSSYRAVQAGHAVAKWLLYDNKTWRNSTLIYLEVKNEAVLKEWIIKLKKEGLPCVYFREPDINNQVTAVATTAGNDTSIFSDMRLL